MNWLDKMNAALDYIEENLTSEIEMDVVAGKACCSSYNFQRMFSFITDIPLAEYIRRRRLTTAAIELRDSGQRIIDVAVKYGYDSATSFARAFSTVHGCTPSQARNSGIVLKAYPRISFQISIKGDRVMDYRIESKEAFDVFGIETIASHSQEKGTLSPAELWQKSQTNGEYERLAANSGELPGFLPQDFCKIHGVENYRKTGEGTFPYMLCAFVSGSSKTEGYTTVHIPAQTYAVFTSDKFEWDRELQPIISDLHKRFHTEWLPTANYTPADAANFEIYSGTPEWGRLEVWYPVTKCDSVK